MRVCVCVGFWNRGLGGMLPIKVKKELYELYMYLELNLTDPLLQSTHTYIPSIYVCNSSVCPIMPLSLSLAKGHLQLTSLKFNKSFIMVIIHTRPESDYVRACVCACVRACVHVCVWQQTPSHAGH